MGAQVQGADLEALARLTKEIQGDATRLSSLTNSATNDVNMLDRLWDGPDSAQFKQLWLRTHRPKMNLAVQQLQDAAATIERNRQAQEATSAADGAGGLGSWGPAFTQGGFGLPFSDLSIAGDIGDFIFGDIGNFWNGGDDGFPVGGAAAALLKLNRIRAHAFGLGPLPVFNTGFVGTRLATLLSNGPSFLNGAGAWLRTPGATATFKWLGVGGGVVSTGLGLYDLYQQGNPIDAFQENGAGYVADVASTAFSASTTAFLLAPNPVTGALALGTGAIWLGAEVVDNWDEITEWTSDAWDAGTDFVSDVGGAAENVVDGAWDAGTDFVGGAISTVSDWF